MSQPLIGIDSTRVYTATEVTDGLVPFGYGDTGVDASGNEYMFVKSDATGLTASAACLITASGSGSTLVFTGAMATTTNTAPGQVGPGGPVGVAAATVAASGAGWLLVRGKGTVLVAASCVKGTLLNTTATAGTLDDDATAGAEVIMGLTLLATATGAAATACLVTYPTVGRTL